MKVPSHLIGLYNRTLRRYKKLTVRLKREKDSEGFRYLTIVQKLKKLRKKLADLHYQLKIAAASGAIVLSLSLTSGAQTTNNGPFTPQPRHMNPLREPFKFDDVTYPAVVDLDKDGDFDLLVGDEGNYSYNGNYSTINPMRYLLNIGTNTNPVYEEKFDDENPFTSIDVVNRHRGPVFADIDNDGDQDLFLATSYFSGGSIYYYRNDDGAFVEQTTAWDPATKTGNPFLGVSLQDHQKLAFGDIDKDSDLDAIVTGVFIDQVTGSAEFISYYKNDGQGTFTRSNSELTFSPAVNNSLLNPALADIDQDGDLDLTLGGYYTALRYYKQVSPGNFVEETEPYDPVAKTGNPFSAIYFPNTQPVFADLDNDSDLDLLLGEGDGDHYYRYPSNIIHFYENKGNAVFEEKLDLDNPLGGVDVKQEASPVLVDVDGDGDLDALIGHKYEDYYVTFNVPYHYQSDNGVFTRKPFEESDFGSIQVAGNITPTLVDLDGDGDLDFITGEYFGGIRFFRNDDGVYNEEVDSSPFNGIDVGSVSAPEFADMDGDGDLDMAVGGRFNSVISYFENTGDANSPIFIERIDAENPFTTATGGNSFNGYLALADVDHDGDFDLLATEYFYFKYYEFNTIAYYENIGTPEAAQFQLSQQQPYIPPSNPFGFGAFGFQPTLADQDQDGDLDLFVGDYFGHVSYTKNENSAVVTTVAGGTLTYTAGVSADITIDPALSLSDEDDDLVVQATVSIANYEQGDELHFVTQAGIAGIFDTSTGVLKLSGKATRADYQAVLQTVTYHHHVPEGGRTSPRKKSTVAKAVEFRVYDTDFTNPQVSSRALDVIFNNPPVLESATETIGFGRIVNIDLADLMSDPDGNLDISTLKITQQPASGATAQIDAANNLVVDYKGVTFTGIDNLMIEVCDDLGECAQSLITINVQTSGELEIYNAIAPQGNGGNAFMRIFGLPEGNKVTIYSRWGDEVLKIENYDNDVPGRRFEGNNGSGKALPSGTYFYKIDIPDTPGYTGPRLMTGFLTLKQ